MQNNIINEIPEPFHSFLVENEKPIGIASARTEIANQARNDSNQNDLLFLAAILMLCDD
ncbi:MAG: hypothetical protein FWE33_08055 [Defluviitaleaceae bacterium]|nr:hypothetical protein [Defluviitaleaceae bacterium]